MTENKIKESKEWLQDFTRMFGCNFDDLETRSFNKIVTYLEELQQYRAISTIEEFKALKEKNEPKKAIFDNKDELCICPCCGKKVGEHQNYCWSCGQAFYT